MSPFPARFAISVALLDPDDRQAISAAVHEMIIDKLHAIVLKTDTKIEGKVGTGYRSVVSSAVVARCCRIIVVAQKWGD